jgi:hypothetical protein
MIAGCEVKVLYWSMPGKAPHRSFATNLHQGTSRQCCQPTQHVLQPHAQLVGVHDGVAAIQKPGRQDGCKLVALLPRRNGSRELTTCEEQKGNKGSQSLESEH